MKKNFGKQTYMYPMPVLIIATYNEDGTPNVMNAAWGGIHDTNQIMLCVHPAHKTAKNFLEKKAFTVSGNDVKDKLAKAGFTVSKAEFVDAPVINELPMCIECTVVSYDTSTGCMVAYIENISAEDSVLTNGKIDPAKLEPITFDPVNHTYIKLGEVVGKAFSDGKMIK